MRSPYFSLRMAASAAPPHFQLSACESRMSSPARPRSSRSRWPSNRFRREQGTETGERESGAGNRTGTEESGARRIDAISSRAKLARGVLESRLDAALAALMQSAAAPSSTIRQGHLALLKRWYYRPEAKRAGEIFFPDADGHWPMKAILRGIGRVAAKSILPRPRADRRDCKSVAAASPHGLSFVRVSFRVRRSSCKVTKCETGCSPCSWPCPALYPRRSYPGALRVSASTGLAITPRWAAANVDPGGWKPYTEYRETGDAYVVWVRCRATFDTKGIQQPVLVVGNDGPEETQLFVDGQPRNILTGIADPFGVTLLRQWPETRARSLCGPCRHCSCPAIRQAGQSIWSSAMVPTF